MALKASMDAQKVIIYPKPRRAIGENQYDSRQPTTDVARHVLVSARSGDRHARNTLY
jgi:hypothetical protein